MAKEPREFQAQLLSWIEIHELPDGWTPRQLLSLLVGMDVDGVSENDALEMTILALQDLEPDEASDRVLEAVFGETMRPGVRRNLAHDLTEERPWEEFADISQQKGIFNAVVLLQQAFPGISTGRTWCRSQSASKPKVNGAKRGWMLRSRIPPCC